MSDKSPTKTDVDSDIDSDVNNDVGRTSITLVNYVATHDVIDALLRQLIMQRYMWL